MFNFTTLHVYNSISTTGADKNLWVATDSKKPALRIGNTRFNAEDILDVYIKNPTVENLASVEFDMTDIIPTEENEVTARVSLYITLSMGDQSAIYSNAFGEKGKPIHIEFLARKGETASTVANRVKKIADKYLIFTQGEKILDVSIVNTGKVTFSAISGYLIISKAALQLYNPEAKTVDCCTTQGDFEDVKIGVPVTYTTNATGVITPTEYKIGENGSAVALGDNEVAIVPGKEAFGDYNWIIHNLRLPTMAHTSFWSPDKNEFPVPGQQYTQFIIRMKKDRDGIAGGILGQRATTVTTHVLYVAGLKTTNGSAAKAVNDAIAALLDTDAATKMKTDADTALQSPFV